MSSDVVYVGWSIIEVINVLSVAQTHDDDDDDDDEDEDEDQIGDKMQEIEEAIRCLQVQWCLFGRQKKRRQGSELKSCRPPTLPGTLSDLRVSASIIPLSLWSPYQNRLDFAGCAYT